jgi:2'-5' RNA ligase
VAGDGRIRLFCALELPDEARESLAGWQASELPAGVGRLVPPKHLHVTLAFLGHRPAGELGRVTELLRDSAAGSAPCELRPRGYRETRGVGMIVLDDVSGAATALAGGLQARLEQAGAYVREARPWLPHVTVLRFRSPAGLRPGLANMCSIHVVRCALYRSQLGRDGARYEVLETAALGGTE